MTPQIQRTIGLLLVIVGIVALATPKLRGQGTSSNADSAAHFQKTFNIAPGGTLAVDNYKGTIHITGSDTGQIAIDVNKNFEGDEADRKWWMENVQINFKNESNRVSVEVKYPQWNCILCWPDHDYTAAVELEIRVPRHINVQLESYKPDIRVAGIQGDIRIKSYKSPIDIADTTGSVRVDTYKETVKLRNVNLRGPLEIKSYKAEAEIEARSLGESVTLENEKGNMVLRVPANAGMDVDYEGSRRASFSSDFAMTSQTGSFDSSFHGKVNQGGTRVRVRTGKGSVSLEKLSGGL